MGLRFKGEDGCEYPELEERQLCALENEGYLELKRGVVTAKLRVSIQCIVHLLKIMD